MKGVPTSDKEVSDCNNHQLNDLAEKLDYPKK